MIATLEETRDVDSMTLNGLDETQPALEQLKEECRNAGEMLQRDVVSGATMVIDAANSIYEFIHFEQEVVRLFDIDTTEIRSGEDSLMEVERDMGDLLERFNVCLEQMDMVGVSELMQESVPEMLTRFQQQLAILRTGIYDVTSS